MHAFTVAEHVGSAKQHTMNKLSGSYQPGPDHMPANPSSLCSIIIWCTIPPHFVTADVRLGKETAQQQTD